MLKNLFCFSTLGLIAFLFTLPVGITSCKKTNTIIDTIVKIDTVVKIKTDTFQEKDTALTVAILTAKSWKLSYSRASIGGNIFLYVRGGSTNNADLTNEFITFNANNTGIYTDNSGVNSTFTWNFSDTTNTKIVWIWNTPAPITVTWENISYDDAALHYTEYFTQNGNNVLATETRIQK